MSNRYNLPLVAKPVPAGFASPADEYVEVSLNLNEHVVTNPNSTFFIRVVGDSMIEAGIFDGDLLVVDKSLEVLNGSIVIAVVNGAFTLKEFRRKSGRIRLVPRNSKYKEIEVSSDADFSVWGVVTHAVTKLR